MNVTAIALIVAGALCCGPIHSIGDLASPIRYVDKEQGYFLGIEKNIFLIGTALNAIKNPANDVPQVDGHVENCSSRTFKCRSIAELVFAIPKSADHSAKYLDGPNISINRLTNGGWHGAATCSMITSTGCVRQVSVSKLVEAYEYDVSPVGVVTSVKIQNWDDNGKLLSTYNLVLVSEAGLKLD